LGKSWRTGRRLAVALGVLALALFAGACGGDDDDDSEEASVTDVTVTATEYAFDLSATPTADTQEVTLQNDGEEPHALVFARINEGFTLDEAFELQGGKGSADEVIRAVEAQPGQSKIAQVKGPLEPGTYAMVCPLETKDGETHFELGQQQEFEIE
jgi:hypothetical protein